MSPLTAVLGDQLRCADWLVTSPTATADGAEGGVCVVTTVTFGAGALR